MTGLPGVAVLAATDPRRLDPPDPGAWDWDFAVDIAPYLLEGLWLTVQATLAGTALALVLGLGLALARRSPRRVVSWPAGAFVEVVRSTPLLVQLFFLFVAIPDLTGIALSPLATGILALGLHYASYTSESYRAGIEGVPRGQWEAARAVNLSAAAMWRHVVLPQAVPAVLPALGNHLIAMFKDAPLLSSITVLELVARAKATQGVWFRGMEPFTVAGILFLAVSLPAAAAVRYLERRCAYERA